MARPLRIEFAGATYHVTSRGDRSGHIFLDNQDRERFLTQLGRMCERFSWRVYSYCLMSNHYHLLLQTSQPNLSAGMRQLNGAYTQHFNRRHDRVGHVLQGRYKAILVEADRHLLELSRYIVLNPVRAHMVAKAGDWPWSSYRSMLNSRAPEWLDLKVLLKVFDEDIPAAREAYARFVEEGVMARSPWEQLRGQVFLGSDEFCARHRPNNVRPDPEITKQQKTLMPLPLAAYEKSYPTRDDAIVAAYKSGGYTLRAIGLHFGLHYSVISRIARRARD